MAPASVHRPRSSDLILYWFWIASDMATIRVGSCPLHVRWFIAPWIQASSFAAMPLHGSLTVSDFSPQPSTHIYPSFFSASGPQNRNVHSIHPLICQFFVCSERGFRFFKRFSSYHSPAPYYTGLVPVFLTRTYFSWTLRQTFSFTDSRKPLWRDATQELKNNYIVFTDTK
jgi:hypothetical protein